MVKVLSKRFNSIVIHFARTDKEWSKLVLAKNNSRCVICEKAATAAHIISRRYAATRLVIENGIPLCIKHHNWLDTADEEKYIKFAKFLIGRKLFWFLKELAEKEKPIKTWE